ncbi:IS66 family insertion sequence element accessory protein TnpB [Microvirga tunisiensis]|uniref:Transposase n=1 Tax=Microvirga tunisiensis TaxID=2108360 RepID=A0A5N7N8Y5_9HYPH|nr:IS66 family insertion sequence element accessory protein TnpB [Microvirga tunisiensis]MPR13423.1 transposase [Microvirga tunisiensis]MPR31306.1 transposase [Microvirga tunisiensis]
MIGPGAGVRVYLACGVTDMRRGITGLAALAQEVLHQNPALCVVGDYVAAGSLTVEFQRFAVPGRHII